MMMMRRRRSRRTVSKNCDERVLNELCTETLQNKNTRELED
jgi:hypothetical protein